MGAMGSKRQNKEVRKCCGTEALGNVMVREGLIKEIAFE